MKQLSHPKVYDAIGGGYRRFRVPDPRIAAQIRKAIGDATTVCNVGAGTGSYEPTDLNVIPVEPSERMIQQRDDPQRVVCARAEALPFEDKAFDVAMAVLTVHHWVDQAKGLKEMQRISHRQVILTFDPQLVDTFWLVRDYLPEFADFDKARAPAIESYGAVLGDCRMDPVMVPWDCTDGFLTAYWRRPERYLDPDARHVISTFSQFPADIVSAAIKRLAGDLDSGAWEQRYAHLRERELMDFGYRLIIAQSPS